MASQTKNPAMRPENLTEFQCLLRAGLPMVTESRLLSSYPHAKTGLYTRVKLFMQIIRRSGIVRNPPGYRCFQALARIIECKVKIFLNPRKQKNSVV